LPSRLIALAVFLAVYFAGAGVSVHAARDNELRLAGPVQGLETLDPAQMRDLSSAEILHQIFRGLVYYDDALKPVPELAESWQISDDGLTYTFILREGATFQDGTPITADDVAFSLSRAVNPDTVEGDVSLLAGPPFLSDIAGYTDVVSGNSDALAGITVIDERTLSIGLIAPRSTFLMKLASIPATIVNRAEVESDDAWWARPNGSGPYRVSKWEPGESLELKRYDKFVQGKPSVATISVRLGSSALQSFNLYQADEIDIDSISLYDLDRVTDPNGEFADQLVRTPQFGFDFIALRSDVAPLDDPRIRKALQLAFPREQLADITFNGQVEPAYGLIPAQMLGQTWPKSLPNSDLDKARKLITESSYGAADKVPPIRIYTSGPLAAELLRAVAGQELGLRIEVFDLEWLDFLDRLDRGVLPAYELFWSADYPDPEAMLRTLWGTGEPDNYADYSNPGVDKALEGAAEAADPATRAGYYVEAETAILEDNVVIPAYMDVRYTVVKPWVRNLVVTPMGILRYESVKIDR
jgi:ABC-type transport system substrate-binding protein